MESEPCLDNSHQGTRRSCSFWSFPMFKKRLSKESRVVKNPFNPVRQLGKHCWNLKLQTSSRAISTLFLHPVAFTGSGFMRIQWWLTDRWSLCVILCLAKSAMSFCLNVTCALGFKSSLHVCGSLLRSLLLRIVASQKRCPWLYGYTVSQWSS